MRRVAIVLGCVAILAIIGLGIAKFRGVQETMRRAATIGGAKSLSAGIAHCGSRYAEEMTVLTDLLPSEVQIIGGHEYDAIVAFVGSRFALDRPTREEGMVDAWGKPYRITGRRAADGTLEVQEIRSAGPDRVFGSEDDLLVTDQR